MYRDIMPEITDEQWKKICAEEGLFENDEEMVDAFLEDFSIKLDYYRCGIGDVKLWEQFTQKLIDAIHDYKTTSHEACARLN